MTSEAAEAGGMRRMPRFKVKSEREEGKSHDQRPGIRKNQIKLGIFKSHT